MLPFKCIEAPVLIRATYIIFDVNPQVNSLL